MNNVNNNFQYFHGPAAAGVVIEIGQDKTTITNSNFTGNIDTINRGAGALSVATGSLEVFNTTFIGNVGKEGGALTVQDTRRSDSVTSNTPATTLLQQQG